jgi:hypothetical protein
MMMLKNTQVAVALVSIGTLMVLSASNAYASTNEITFFKAENNSKATGGGGTSPDDPPATGGTNIKVTLKTKMTWSSAMTGTYGLSISGKDIIGGASTAGAVMGPQPPPPPAPQGGFVQVLSTIMGRTTLYYGISNLEVNGVGVTVTAEAGPPPLPPPPIPPAP